MLFLFSSRIDFFEMSYAIIRTLYDILCNFFMLAVNRYSSIYCYSLCNCMLLHYIEMFIVIIVMLDISVNYFLCMVKVWLSEAVL